MNFSKSKELFKEGNKHLVGAVNSPVRAYKSVGGNPIFIEKAKGAYIYDVDGNEFIDYVQSYGPMILGHGNETVLKAVQEAIPNGFSFGATTQKEIELAAIICNTFPSVDMVRFVNSGTEAIMSAIRLARAYTKKNKIIKFAGCYHGHSDALLVAAGSGLVTFSLPGSVGVPQEAVNNTLIANYNDIESVKKHIEETEDIAAVFIEPIAGNMGVVIPTDSFIKELRAITQEKGILLVIDEVMSGFRSKFGGAQDLLGIEADITCLGKIIGGGFPIGAYGARRDIMQMIAPLGDVYQAGTLSGNPVAMACGIATMQELKKANPYADFEKNGAFLEKILLDSAKENGIDLQVNRYGAMLNPFFTNKKVTNFEDAQTSDTDLFAKFFWGMIKNGIYLPPSQYEAWFLSTEIREKELQKTAEAIQKTFKMMQ